MAKGDVLVRMKADVGNYNANLAAANRTLKNFREENLSLGGIVKNMTRSFTGYAAGLMSIGAVAGKLHETVTEAVQLAKSAEGIRLAFNRLNDPGILDGLRQATHGTVTDVELMKAAVKFNDFKLPLDQLGTMLAFAQQKAKDTGQSVDYMVDSIVTGLGRKSKPILDNLGISATEIDEKMKQTGDMTKAVGEIIREQMSKAGDYVETAADRAAQANVSLQNKMEELGRKFAPLEEASSNLWTSMKLGILDIISGPLATLLNQLTEAGRMNNMLGKLNGGGDSSGVQSQLQKLRISKAVGSGYMMRSLYSEQVEQYNRQIMGADKLLKQFGHDHSSVNTVLQAASRQFGIKFDSISDLKAFQDAYIQMKNEYIKGAQEIMNATKAGSPVLPVRDVKGGKTTKTTKTELTELQKNQQTINTLTQEYVRLGDESTEAARKRQEEIQKEIQLLEKRNGLLGLRAEQAHGRWSLPLDTNQTTGLAKDGLQLSNPFASDDKASSLKLQLDDKAMSTVTKQIDKQLKKQQESPKEVKLTDVMGQMGSGISSIVSGIEALGIEIPQGMKDVLGGIQTVTTILSGIATIVAAIEVISTAKLLPFVGANGGVIKAAGGYRVPGRTFSGDMIPARLNAGETVLNQAQAGVIANALQDREFGGGSGTMQPYVDGEKIFLGMNNTSKRMGRGEIVTTGTLRRLGLI